VEGQLSRPVPARTKIVRFPWVRKDFSFYTEQWRAVRAKCGKPIDNCWWCKTPFGEGDQIALAAREHKTNVCLCQTCAAKALSRESGASNG
jgi:hypothetical protein